MISQAYKPTHGGYTPPRLWPPVIAVSWSGTPALLPVKHEEYESRDGVLYKVRAPYAGWRVILDDCIPRQQ